MGNRTPERYAVHRRHREAVARPNEATGRVRAEADSRFPLHPPLLDKVELRGILYFMLHNKTLSKPECFIVRLTDLHAGLAGAMRHCFSATTALFLKLCATVTGIAGGTGLTFRAPFCTRGTSAVHLVFHRIKSDESGPLLRQEEYSKSCYTPSI